MNTTKALTLSDQDEFPVAYLSGEIDGSNAIEIETELTYAVSNSVPGLIIDLTDVSFMDSSGIRFLFDLAVRLEQRQQVLRLVVPQNSDLLRTLKLVQLPAIVSIFDDVGQAAAGEPGAPSGSGGT
jgi:anti-anti-sigma factor